jgi:hypothetical protein
MRTGRLIRITLLMVLVIPGISAIAQKKYAFTAREAVQYAIQNVNDVRNLKGGSRYTGGKK